MEISLFPSVLMTGYICVSLNVALQRCCSLPACCCGCSRLPAATLLPTLQLQQRHQQHYSCSSVINHITAPAKGRHSAGNEVAAVHLYVTLLSILHHQAHIARRGRRVRKLQELCILYLTSPCQEQVAANKASGAMAANRQSGLWMR